MRWFIHLSLSGLLAFFLIAATGCKDPGSTTVAQTDASDSDDDHDHDDDDHGEHAHGGEHKHPETYDEAVTELLAIHKAIAEAFAADNADDAHGPLHDVGHLLEDTEALVEKADMDDDTKKKLHEAIEQLFASYSAVDDKMHDEDEGKDYSDVAKQIEDAISTLKAQAKISQE
ncbi:MAG: hypothetical protein MI861_11150 [Pirellulales bacterium]|nr:hypothetical protein [Pirellulales bacterium]